jgi:hypothetical protein
MRLIYVTHRVGQYDPQVGATNPDPGAITIRESRGQISFLFAFLTLASAVALVRLVPNAHTTSGRVVGAVGFGVLLVVFLVGWIVAIRRSGRLEITQGAISYVKGNGQVSTLSRQQGNRLRWAKELRGRIWKLGLTIDGTDTVMVLGIFSRRAVQQACLARGWRFR